MTEECTFKEYLIDIIKICIESYKAIFADTKKKLKEVPEVGAFIAKAVWKNKKEAMMLLAIQSPFLGIYLSFRYLKYNVVYMIIGIILAIITGIVLQAYYYYLLNNKKRIVQKEH